MTEAQQQADPNEPVIMKIKDVNGTATVTRRQFDKVYKAKGWEEVTPNKDGSLPKNTPPQVTPSGVPEQAPTEAK